jgi:hypothetical protein
LLALIYVGAVLTAKCVQVTTTFNKLLTKAFNDLPKMFQLSEKRNHGRPSSSRATSHQTIDSVAVSDNDK